MPGYGSGLRVDDRRRKSKTSVLSFCKFRGRQINSVSSQVTPRISFNGLDKLLDDISNLVQVDQSWKRSSPTVVTLCFLMKQSSPDTQPITHADNCHNQKDKQMHWLRRSLGLPACHYILIPYIERTSSRSVGASNFGSDGIHADNLIPTHSKLSSYCNVYTETKMDTYMFVANCKPS